MYQGKIISKIQSLDGSYTKSEQKIIKYLIKNLKETVHLSVTEFSDETGVGETTIVRFCKKLGYKGYHDFKLAIAQDFTITKKIKSNQQTAICDRVFQNMMTVLEDSKNLLDHNSIDKTVKMIEEARSVYFYGVGASGITAQEAQSKFFRIAHKFHVVTDNHFQMMASQIMSKEDLIIVITISGSTKDIVDAVASAKQRGAKVIAITNFQKSPITKYSDIVLLTSGKMSLSSGGSLVEKISQLFVIDILFMEYIAQNEDYLENRKLTAMSVSSKRY
ncbi:MurR/RpiR family transcriptional regulator [Mycoplasmatota bacterium]|nr:MurR/RpiR family transcriptional regulator [Mycoplasmatota bacterium]